MGVRAINATTSGDAAGSETVNRAVRDGLRDARDALAARRIAVEARLEAVVPLESEPPALYQAIYTLARGLPERLPPGSTLRVATRDRAGGDVELSFEVSEGAQPADPSPRDALRAGPYGDLFELALLGLEAICRARAGILEAPEPLPATDTVRRRYAFLVPTRSRDPRGRY